MTDLRGLGAYIRQWRRALSLSQEELAQLSGVNRKTIIRLEKGAYSQRPQYSIIRLLASTLDVSVTEMTEFLGGIMTQQLWSHRALDQSNIDNPMYEDADVIIDPTAIVGITRYGPSPQIAEGCRWTRMYLANGTDAQSVACLTNDGEYAALLAMMPGLGWHT